MQNKGKIFPLITVGVLVFSATQISAQDGEATFNKTCKACHTIGGGKLVGPDLIGINSKRSESWLTQWTKSSQTLINSGDTDAKAVFEANNKIPMPDQNLTDAEIKAVYEFIAGKSPQGGNMAADTAKAAPVAEITSSGNASAQDIELGKAIFEGSAPLTNGGAACISCHNVNYPGIIAGGLLAKDLTTAHSRMGGDAGLAGILGAPPFPAMSESYKNKPMTQTEIAALTAFLNKANKDSALNQPTGNPLLTWGGIGLIGWICLVFVLWYRRKKNTVKLKIYERQIKSI